MLKKPWISSRKAGKFDGIIKTRGVAVPMKRQMMRQMQKKVQDSLSRIQEDLATEEVEGSAGGGLVRIKVNGSQEVLSVKIAPSVVNPEEVDVLEDLVMVAIKDAMSRAQEIGVKRMSQLTGGLGLPQGLL